MRFIAKLSSKIGNSMQSRLEAVSIKVGSSWLAIKVGWLVGKQARLEVGWQSWLVGNQGWKFQARLEVSSSEG
jgi:hypothetical protein